MNPELTEVETRIDVKESWDVNFWCEELNLRAEELKEIVKVVGPQIHDVRVHLAKKLMMHFPLSY
ncbi:MAG: DUF3606 domain-containing protein [Bdellovibrionota bacterium]